jgi:hypothetical protein
MDTNRRTGDSGNDLMERWAIHHPLTPSTERRVRETIELERLPSPEAQGPVPIRTAAARTPPR